MPIIYLTTTINAPIQRCFDLSRSIDLHQFSMAHTKEVAIAGVTTGLIGLNETVTWRATHLGVSQTLSSKITMFNSPFYFRDEMIQGIFKLLRHDHFFEANGNQTIMKDVFEFEAPLGVLGKLANGLFLKRYLTAVLKDKNQSIKMIAESDEWRRFLSNS